MPQTFSALERAVAAEPPVLEPDEAEHLKQHPDDDHHAGHTARKAEDVKHGTSPVLRWRRCTKPPWLVGRWAEDVHVALRKRDLDAVLVEQAEDLQEDFTGDVADAMVGVFDPEAQLEINRVLTKAEHQRRGLRLPEHPWRIRCGTRHQLQRPRHVSPEGHGN